ncbi:MAG: XrtA system polysaccharide chain length determinant [bacterium]
MEGEKNEKKVNISDYIELISHRRCLFFATFALIVIAIMGYVYTAKEKYEATSTILVEREKIINPLMKGLATQANPDRLNAIKQLILSKSRLLEVIKKLNLDSNIKKPLELEGLIEGIKESITIEIIDKNLYSIKYEGDNPKTVKSITDAITNLFIEENLGATKVAAHDALNFVKGQLEIYKNKLEESENALRIFKEKNIGQMPGEQNVNLSQLENSQTLITELEISLKEAVLEKSFLTEQLANERPLIVALSSNDEDSLEGQLKKLEANVQILLTRYTEKYPEVIKSRAEIEEIKKGLARREEGGSDFDGVESQMEALNPTYQQLREKLNEASIKINSLQTRIKEYKGKIGLYESKVRNIPKEEQKLTRLTRDYNVNESIYQALLNKMEEARISKELELKEKSYDFQVIDAAELPILPSSPNRPGIILFGIILGLGAGFGVVYLVNYSDTSILDVPDAKIFFKYPVLAGIPIINSIDDLKKIRIKNVFFFLLVGIFTSSIIILLLMETAKRYTIPS